MESIKALPPPSSFERKLLRWLGRPILTLADTMGRIVILCRQTLYWLRSADYHSTMQQIVAMGVDSLPVTTLTSLFTGMVLALQTGFSFRKVFNEPLYVGTVVGLSLTKELGPVLTAVVVAGRVGAAIAAELGTMRVTEQIDALRTLATHPVDYLVVPRLVAGHLTLPLLTAEAMAVGIGAGYFVGVYLLGIDPTYLWWNMLKYTSTSDVAIGLIKSFVYGGIVALIGCYKGMYCGEGAEGVGRATTESVVYSSITILIANFFLTLALGAVFNKL